MHLSTLLFNIYLMGMVEELERAQLVVKLEDCWCGALIYADDIVLIADSGDGAADYVGGDSSICDVVEDEVQQ